MPNRTAGGPWLLSIVALSIALLGGNLAAQQLPYTYNFGPYSPDYQAECYECFGRHADPTTGGTSPQLRYCYFPDRLPEGAVVQSIRLVRRMSTDKRFDWQHYPTVAMDLNGTQIVPPFQITNFDTSCGNDSSIKVFETPYFAEGFPGYVYGGVNAIGTYIEGGNAWLADMTLTVRYVLALGVKPIPGADGQRGIIGHALLKKLAVSVIAPAGMSPAGQTVRFELINQPSNANGATLGPIDGGSAPFFDATSDASGKAEVYFRLGDQEGAYTVHVHVLDSPGKSTDFYATAEAPARTAILFNDRELPPGSSVSLLSEPRMRAAGFGADNHLLGYMEAAWDVSAKGKGAGAASVAPEDSGRIATLTPESAGPIAIKANTALKGKTTSATVLIGGVFLDADGKFDIAAPRDDLDWFVPGTNAEDKKTSVAIPTGENPPPLQVVRLLVPNSSSKQGTIDFKILETTNYPGVAMNWPAPDKASTEPDVYFLDGTQKTQSLLKVPFGPGVTQVNLYIDDFAAWCRLEVTISYGKTKKYPSVVRTIPSTDQYNNKMPDHGWEALANSVKKTFTPIKNTGLDETDDEDNSPTAETIVAKGLDPDQSQPFGKTGDGLSTFQEYRGFVVDGFHRRLNPYRKDFFVVLDDGIPSWMRTGVVSGAQTLEATVHAMNSTDAKLNALNVSPVINANRAGVPGADYEQRAVLLRVNEDNPPTKVEKGFVYPAWGIGYFGLTFYDGSNLASIPSANVTYRSPNGTQVAEIYPRAFVQHRIYPGGPNQSFYSSLACLTPAKFGCDSTEVDDDGHWFIGPGADGVLNTSCDPQDICQGRYFTCATGKEEIRTNNFTDLQVFSMTHELGHGLNMFHAYDIEGQPECGTMMGFLYLPPPTAFSVIERQMLRVHEN